MKILITNLVILFTALVLSIILMPFGLGYTIGYRLIHKTGLTYLSDIFLKVAESIDQLGNVICGDFFDIILTRTGRNFGGVDDTVSVVIARNYNYNLTTIGILLGNILELIDPSHLEKALEASIY